MRNMLVRMLALILLALALPMESAQAAPQLALEASTVRSEFLAGETFTISAYLFNDGDSDITGDIRITAPAGFELIGPDSAAGDIGPDRALQLDACYRVAADAPKGLARFVVTGGGLTREVIVRVGPVTAPDPAPPPVHRVYLPAFL